MQTELILASTSPWRRELLARLRLPFVCMDPDFDESPCGSMPPDQLVRHNTLGKARSIALRHSRAAVIASDQLALCGNQVLGKPGNLTDAKRQLRLLSGKKATFLTGVALIGEGMERYACVPYQVYFRQLSEKMIRRYVELERPLGCAGSFKSEGLGIALFERMQGEDPTALIGLPLIQLCSWLNPLSLSQRYSE